MRWEDERYVRVFTRDTPDWCALSWEAQALFLFLLRRVDRAGLVPLGRSGARGLAGMVGMPVEVVERALPELLADGCVQQSGTTLVIPNFVAAQESPQSDKLRARESRTRARDRALAKGPEGGDAKTVTKRDGASQNVTDRHAPSHGVTPSHTASLCAVPIRTSPPNPPSGGVCGDEAPKPSGAEVPDVRCPTVEPAPSEGAKLEWPPVEQALRADGGGTVDPEGAKLAKLKLLRLLGEMNCTLDDVRALAKFCRARPSTFPRWASHYRTLNLGHLLTEKLAEGSGLADLVSNARAWAKAEAAKPSPPIDPKGPRVVPGAARTDAEAAESAKLLAEGAFARAPKLRAVEPAPQAKAVGE